MYKFSIYTIGILSLVSALLVGRVGVGIKPNIIGLFFLFYTIISVCVTIFIFVKPDTPYGIWYLSVLLIIQILVGVKMTVGVATSINKTQRYLYFDGLAKQRSSIACKALRRALFDELTSSSTPISLSNSTLEYLKNDFLNPDKRNQIIGKILYLKDPLIAKSMLVELLDSEEKFVALRAATALALLNSKEGLKHFTHLKAMTNSGIEVFFAQASLKILSEPIPLDLKNRAIFKAKHKKLIEDCE